MLTNKLSSRNIILASGSPRRSALMRECGLNFTVADKYGVRESYPADMPPEDVPLYLAGLKSRNYPVPLAPADILITADTIVILDGEILGKPRDGRDAVRMLHRLSGREHTVVSGVLLRDLTGERGFSAHTTVRFAALTTPMIEDYVERFAPMDKAGSYAIQEWIGYIGIESICGSFYNVMGLPTERLCRELEAFAGKFNSPSPR
jgi:septum formation protein